MTSDFNKYVFSKPIILYYLWYGHLLISSVYSPPKQNVKKDTYEQFFKTLERRFIVDGDFNAKHTECGSRQYQKGGKFFRP